jgi:nucleotide-binding universal stress UspA family protein
MSSEFSEPHPLTLTHIFHPTDFSLSPEIAFAHALKLTLATKAKLTVFHVNKGLETTEFEDFPHVQDTLARWGFGSEEGSRPDIKRLGVPVETILAHGDDPTASILAYLDRHPAGLIVLATHQLGGQPFFPSIAEPVARRAGVMTLFIPSNTRGFVRGEDGAFNLRRILIPIDHHPNPQIAIQAICGLVQAFECEKIAFTLLHVGSEEEVPFIYTPRRTGWTWHISIRTGDVVSQIIQCEKEEDADLIVMTTEGHKGFLDALRGNTTERVLRNAGCPVLAVPSE